MVTGMKTLIRLWHDESGATAIEYMLLLALIAVGIIGSLQSIAQNFIIGPAATVSGAISSR